jgi:hypothetical protein
MHLKDVNAPQKDHKEDTKITGLYAIFVSSLALFVANSSQNFSLTPN